jgi:predicted dehydrogenase
MAAKEIVMSATKKNWTRRQFMQSAATAAASIAAVPNIMTSTAWGATKRTAANERMGIGVIGLGGRGRSVMNAFIAQPDTQVKAVCDCSRERREMGRDQVNEKYHNKDCDTHRDMFELLARDDIDAVLIATGDNWHSGVSVIAARAGKDIYCEKPMSVAINESRAVSDTMRRLGTVYQCGTQRRSIAHFRFAAHLAQSGKLGNLKEMHAEEAPWMPEFNYDILPAQPEPDQDEFDWNRWLGPAQWRPYNKETYSRGFWSKHADFSGAAITEWGSHTVDLCQWAKGSDTTSPIEYWKEGDRYMARYADGVKLVIRKGLRFGSCPVRYEGDEGWVETGDSGEIDAYPKSLLQDRHFEGGYPPDNHVRVFLDCVKTREKTNANAEAAHRSITACHVANLCKRLGRPIKWDPVKEEVVGDAEAQRLTTRAYREPWYL